MNACLRDSIGQTVQHNRKRYFENLEHGTPDRGWDAVVLTAGNKSQAAFYEDQIEHRRRQGLLPSLTDFLVVPDPPGHRIGSGGSTLLAIQRLLQHFASSRDQPSDIHDLRGRKLLILHSGGESRRLPMYSGIGKLFAHVPLPLGLGVSTLFDEFLVSLSGAPARFREGLVVASGDVLLLFDAQQLQFHSRGIVGVSMPAEPDIACRHGVYLADGHKRVRRFLHKQSPDSLQQAGAIHDGMAPIDTGIVWFDLQALHALLDAAPAGHQPLSLYADLLAIPALETRRSDYLNSPGDAGPPSAALLAHRKILWDGLRDTPFHVDHLREARFIHFGTSVEYHDALLRGCCAGAGPAWQPRLAVTGSPGIREDQPPRNTVLLNCVCHEAIDLKGMLIEDSFLGNGVSARDGIISRVQAGQTRVVLPPECVLFQAPVHRNGRFGTATFILGMHDPLKTPLAGGGAWLNRSWTTLLAGGRISGLAPELSSAAGGGALSLWELPVFPVSGDAETSLQQALQWAAWITQDPAAHQAMPRPSPPGERISLADAMAGYDTQQAAVTARDLADRIAAGRFCDAVRRRRPALESGKMLGLHADDIGRRLALATENRDTPVETLHHLYCAGDVLSNHCDPATHPELWKQASRYHNQAFERLAQLIRGRRSRQPPGDRDPPAAAVTVRAAARLDFGGGWSDTPPFSLSEPGTVINAAISLNDQLPITVTVEPLPAPVVELCSRDQDISLCFNRCEPLQDYSDPADPVALHKAALALCGVLPPSGSPAAGLFDGSCGLRIITDIKVPKGSGLGTSSILAGALLTALYQAFGIDREPDDLFNDIFDLEQMLTTGGGWQDQVGGLTAGIKLTTSKPGIPPTLTTQPVDPAPAVVDALNRHLVLIYTGQRRLAKNILRTIMGRYLANDPGVRHVLHAIQDIARDMHTAILAGDWETLGKLMTTHWTLNQRMDPGSTNPAIDALFECLTPFIAGGKLAGAGGGGFIEAIVRDPDRDIEAIRERLADRFPDAAIWHCRITTTPLTIE